MLENKAYHEDTCELVRGNAINLDLNRCDCEVRADIKVETKNCVRIWGQVTDCYGKPVKDALVKLIKPYFSKGCIEYTGVAHTVTDCLGFYQFDICQCDDEKAKYRVLVSKPAFGKERVLPADSICEPCEKQKCDD